MPGATSGIGLLLATIAARPCSRSDLMEGTGLARTTVSQYLATLQTNGLVVEGLETFPSTGGRPARILDLRRDVLVTLVADVGETHARLAVADLRACLLVEGIIDVDLHAPPGGTLMAILDTLRDLLRRCGRCEEDVLGIGLGLPAPVDFGPGCVVGPSIMSKWDGFDIPAWFALATDVPVVVENDVNLLALCEHRTHWSHVAHLLYVKAGTGIGSGILANGELYRGGQGAAGDIGHIQADPINGPLCRCGKKGCLEASAAGWALVRDLAGNRPASSMHDLLDLVAAHRPDVIDRVRAAGRAIGATIASVVSVLNPQVIVVGGSLGRTGELMLGGMRELVHQRSLPLATRELTIANALGGDKAGLKGAALLVVERQLGLGRVDATLKRLTEARAASARVALRDPHAVLGP